MKIIGNTVGTTLPKPSFDQTDPGKGDYIRGDRSFTKGDPGAVFVPAVDAQGNLSWSNEGGLANPETVNLKGADGYTPVKGTDYCTEEDRDQLVAQVLEQLPGAVKLHTVQEGNLYTMTVTLSDGSDSVCTVTVEDGLPVKITADGVQIPMTWEVISEAVDLLGSGTLSGGWTSAAWGISDSLRSDVSPQITQQAMVLTLQRGATAGGCGLASAKAVDLTGVQKVRMGFDLATAASRVSCTLVRGTDPAAAPAGASEAVFTADVTGQVLELDVSGVSGEQYLGICLEYEGEVNCVTNLTVKELVME